MLRPRSIVRPLGEAALVFDPLTWQTHLLPAELAAVAAVAEELALDGPVTATWLRQALAAEADESEATFDDVVAALADVGLVET
ncbi:HPr-rel-A system PqqD family peptide chaperone [Thauera sp. SDU_THAU2]|uniref:HPr-rel-A system PqqD family peptide chaperone n=1 Tax=Thauera sp. SDU_THAU2 TaxID=3136633 RepID=UPI00311FE9D9